MPFTSCTTELAKVLVVVGHSVDIGGSARWNRLMLPRTWCQHSCNPYLYAPNTHICNKYVCKHVFEFITVTVKDKLN